MAIIYSDPHKLNILFQSMNYSNILNMRTLHTDMKAIPINFIVLHVGISLM